MRLFLKLQTVVETLMLGGMLFQRIDPHTLKYLSPVIVILESKCNAKVLDFR